MEVFRACAVLLVLNLKFILAVDAKPYEEIKHLMPLRFRLLQNGKWQSMGKMGNHGNQEPTKMHLESNEGRCACPDNHRRNCACVDRIVYFQNPSNDDALAPNRENKRQEARFDVSQKRQSDHQDKMVDNNGAEREHQTSGNIIEMLLHYYPIAFPPVYDQQLRNLSRQENV